MDDLMTPDDVNQLFQRLRVLQHQRGHEAEIDAINDRLDAYEHQMAVRYAAWL